MLFAVIAAVALLLVSACGAKTGLPGEDGTTASTVPPVQTGPPRERACVLGCTIGHECCAGSCSGPAVPMLNDCCPCLDGEVISQSCATGHCAR